MLSSLSFSIKITTRCAPSTSARDSINTSLGGRSDVFILALTVPPLRSRLGVPSLHGPLRIRRADSLGASGSLRIEWQKSERKYRSRSPPSGSGLWEAHRQLE